MQLHILKGHYVTDSGLLERATILVNVSLMGVAYDAEGGFDLTARTEKCTSTETWNLIGNGIWDFAPDQGELERAGIVVLSIADEQADRNG